MRAMKLSERTIQRAYEAHALVYDRQRGWDIPHHVECWCRAQAAFDNGSFVDFKWLYQQLRNYWFVFRPYTTRSWSAAQTFDCLRRLESSWQRLALHDLGDESLRYCLNIIIQLKDIKPNKTGPSIVAISKFLHFWNPRLFVIVDDAVMWQWVFEHDWIWNAVLSARNELAIHDNEKDSIGESCDVASFLAILTWSRDLLLENPSITHFFAEHVRKHANGTGTELPLETYEAAAVEWLLLGLVELPPSGVECG